MKYLVASDIHGSAYYAHKLVHAFATQNCDKMLLLGDILYHGPRNALPKDYDCHQVYETLNPFADDIICVRGNCDAEIDDMVLDFDTRKDYDTITEDNYQIVMSHGHIYNPEHLPPINEGDIFLFGHIHVPKMEEENGIYIINPGSISIPKENSSHSYGILENKVFTFYDDEGNVLKQFDMNN